MTVLKRRRPAPEPEPVIDRSRRRRPRLPLDERFPVGQRVQVYADFSDERYAEKIGKVLKVDLTEDDIYPKGRVAVLLVWHELVHRLFGGKPPNPVWFRPENLEKLES